MLTEKVLKNSLLKNTSIIERVSIVTIRTEFHVDNPVTFNYLNDISKSINKRDKIQKFSIKNENDERWTYNNEDTYNKFINNTLSGQVLTLEIKVKKFIKDGVMTVYNLDGFGEDLIKLDKNKFLETFSDLLKDIDNYIVFETQEDIIPFNTNTIYFTSHAGLVSPVSTIERKELTNKYKDVTFIPIPFIYNLIPEDFNWISSHKANKFEEIFNKINTILSLMYISNTSTIENEYVKGNIIGQRNLEYNIDITSLNSNDNIFKIYKWIYTDGNHVDKSIIARNILSIHCKLLTIQNINKDIVLLIYSNYNLYLKSNADKYLEAKEQISNSIIKIINESRQYSYKLLAQMGSNLVAVFVFILTVVLTSITSSLPVEEKIFRDEIIVMLELIAIGSLVYAYISNKLVMMGLNDLFQSYNYLRNYYSDLFSGQQLDDIFMKYSVSERKQEVIKEKDKYYCSWIIAILVFLILIEAIGGFYSVNAIKEVLISILNNK